MYRLLPGLVLFLAQELCAQNDVDRLEKPDNYIINATVYKRGVYKTFDEFKYNNPAITEGYVIEKNKLRVTDASTGEVIKIKRKGIWGFCDGTRIFVSWNSYNEVLDMGRYCYFMEKGIRIVSVYGFPPLIVPIPLPYKDELIINFNTGKTYILSKRILKLILKTDDPELLTEFMSQQRKGKKLHDYLMKYNERNVAKIK